MNDRTIDEQIDYYRARAGEYDEWFHRHGRYDRGATHKEQWQHELATLQAALANAPPYRRALELACGTGLWTERLAAHADAVTAVDAAQEMLEINRARVDRSSIAQATVEYVETDIFQWQPPHRYDLVFFSFWLSHVPATRFDQFWELVDKALASDGTVFFVDSAYTPNSTALDHKLGTRSDDTEPRRLNDGREFNIVKIFYEPEALQERMETLGWRGTVQNSGEFFIYAELHRYDAE
jgi:demethylmenaquinone methyltransferase/2-methoxy-6-polyprenyl-1,4-benzoquinol methylase